MSSKKAMQRAAMEDFPLPEPPKECVGLVSKVKGQSLFEVCIPKSSFEAYLQSDPTHLSGLDFHIVPLVFSNDKKMSLPVPSSLPSSAGGNNPSLTDITAVPDHRIARLPGLSSAGACGSQEWLLSPGIDKDEQTMSKSMREQQEQVLIFVFELPPKYRNTIWVKRGDDHSCDLCVLMLSFVGSFVIVEWYDKISGKVSGEIRHILFVKQMKYIKETRGWPAEFNFGITTRTKTTEDLWPSSASSSDMGDLDSHSEDVGSSSSSSDTGSDT
jgi:hypothetical protein